MLNEATLNFKKTNKKLGSVDISDLDVPRLIRGSQFDLSLYNRIVPYARSLDPAVAPRDVGLRKMNCQQALTH